MLDGCGSFWPLAIAAADTGGYPIIRACIQMIKCADGLVKLNSADQAFAGSIFTQARLGSTESDVTLRAGRAPYSVSPKMSAKGKMWYEASWYTTESKGGLGAPYFKVLFRDDHAVSVRWVSDGLNKTATARVLE